MDIQAIMAFGVLSTPALAVDGSIEVVGRVPSVDALRDMLVAASASHAGAATRRFHKGSHT
jgi:hypothetical protein